MSSLNKVTLIGNLGKNPEIHRNQNGVGVANFSIATSERWRDKDGQQREQTEWHRVVVFSEGLVSVVESYLKAGSKVYLEGQLATRAWTDKEERTQYVTEVVLRGYGSKLIMLNSKDQK